MQESIMFFFFVLFFPLKEGRKINWSHERRLSFCFPQSQEWEIWANFPSHCFTWSVIPVRYGYNFVFFNFISAYGPFSGIELHGDQSLGVQGIPEIIGPVMRKAIVQVLVDEKGKFSHRHEHANEPGANVKVLGNLDDVAVFVHVLAFPTDQSIGKFIFGPGIVLAHIHGAIGTFAGVEAACDEVQNGLNSGLTAGKVVFPRATELMVVMKKLHSFFMVRHTLEVAGITDKGFPLPLEGVWFCHQVGEIEVDGASSNNRYGIVK